MEQRHKESVDTFIPAGTLFCNYHSYYADEASHAFYDACTNVRVLRIPAHDYNDLIDNSHTFAKWCLSMAQCQQYTYELRDVRRSGTIKERYDVMQRTRPFILREVPLKTIAAYLGVVPQYLSTLRKEWLKDNGQDS